MGGFFRAITRIFKQPVQQPAQIITTQAPMAATKKIDRRPGQGTGVTGTIMTDATGLEDEANVSKAILGGTTKKKKKMHWRRKWQLTPVFLPRDEGAWWAAVYGVAQSRTRLKQLSSSSSKKFLAFALELELFP